ncbi:RHS repeat-associated core domain-containing protein, partial [Parapedobacter sp. ISTM3]|nr:RHS repeat-associated core domain-containing protein [Parapedobacter sp. ISTM3]
NGTSFAESVNYSYNARGWLKGAVSPKFQQTLLYEDTSASSFRQYNGNISRQSWRHGTGAVQGYSYTYDRQNRLLTGLSGSVGETVTYDRSGNIATLKRDAGAVWTYGYTAAGGNRLQTITGGSATYQYDANGNMTLDGRVNRSVTYNELDLPRTVGGTSATYTYDATGRKLRSVVGGITTDYIDGIEWEGSALNAIHMEEGR